MHFSYYYNAHDVEFNRYPMAHEFTCLRSELAGAAFEWCMARFGGPEPITYPEGHRNDGRWQYGGSRFLFRDENDAFEFRMRWS